MCLLLKHRKYKNSCRELGFTELINSCCSLKIIVLVFDLNNLSEKIRNELIFLQFVLCKHIG